VSIRFVESDPEDSDALLLSPWPESVFAYEPTWSRLAETTHLVAIDLPGFGRSERKDALMSPRAMGDFIVRAADARVAFYDGTWILNAMIEQSRAPRVSSTVAEAFR
jgi:pimeloyl-ACP methyl ester carboxylesterase